MKLCTLILFISLATASAKTSYSQNTKFTLNLENITIKQLFDKIENSSEFIFVYYDNIIDLNKKVSVKANNETVEEILEGVFKSSENTFKVFDRQIVIAKNESSEADLATLLAQQPQKKIISGTVRDSKGLTLPGVTVVVKGTTTGTITGIDGKFTLNIPASAKSLVFSFVGLMPKEISVGTGNVYDVTLSESTTSIEEVVVVGYGTQKKESVVGAITQVNNQSLMRSGSSNVTSAIAGKLSGVLTMQQTGEPGANNSEIVIRGLSSWNGSAPLVLVDGVERDFTTLDPNEINTISVLKDASATAVFGAKGANGVIIVTTKRGKTGKPQLDFSVSYGLQKPTMIPDHVSSYTTMSMLNVAYMNGPFFQKLTPQNVLEEYRNPSTPLNALRYPDVNWYNALMRPFSTTLNANFNVSGGTNFVKYFCSLGYFKEGDIFNAMKDGFYDMNYSYNRFNYRTNIDFQLTKSTTISFNLGGETGIKNQPNNPGDGSNSPLKKIYSASPASFPVSFPAWVLEQVPDPDYPNATGERLATSVDGLTNNPYVRLHSGPFDQYLDSKLFTDLLFDQKLDFVTKGLSFKGKVALSTYYIDETLTAQQTFPEYQLNYDNIGKPGVNPWFRMTSGNEYYQMPPLNINVGGLQGGYYSDLYYEFGFNYANTFGKHSVTGLALMNRNQKNRGTDFAYFNEALVGRVTYDFSHKYLMEFNVGYTGSEQFAPGNRFGVFPSGALGWVVSEEKFFKDAVPWVNKLKLRYSDGLTGSDAAGSRWLYNSGYYSDSKAYIHEDLAANATAQWEEAHKRDIGFDLGLFKNVLSINVDLFDEHRDKMLLTPRSVTIPVGNSFKDLNLGKLEKHGFELEVEFNKTTPTNLNYWVKGIFGYNENRIIFKDDPLYAPDYKKDAGKPLGAQLNGVLLTGTGYFTSVNDIHINPSPIKLNLLNVGAYKFLDYKVDGIISNLDTYPIKGSAYPPITFSLSSGFAYKEFEFNFMFQGDLGKYVNFNSEWEQEFQSGVISVHASQLDYWTPDNPTSNHSTLFYTGGTSNVLGWANQISIEDRFWRKADYLRLKEVYAGYNMSSKFLNRLAGVSKLTLYVTGNNLWTLTNLIEGDPERTNFATGFYPLISSVKFGVKVTF